MTSNSEHISRLQEAQDLLREALGILRDVNSESYNGSADGYLIPAIEMSIDDDHPWIGRQFNVQDWIDDLRDGDLEEDEDDYDENTEDDDLDAVLDEQRAAPPAVISEPVDPATFLHTPEFAADLWSDFGEAGRKIQAIMSYRREYPMGLAEAKAAVDHIFNTKGQS